MKNLQSIFIPATPIVHRKTHEIISGVLVFIVVPLLNVLIICAGKESALYNSLSRLAWPEGLLWLIYIWGLLNAGTYGYAMCLVLRAGAYNTRWRRLIWALEILSALLLTAGISIPAYADRGDYYEMLRTVHTAICAVGLFGFLVILLLINVTLFGRNKRQAVFSLFFNAFTLIVGVFFLVKVSDPASYCHVSAPSQVLVFDLFNVGVILDYYGMVLLPNEYAEALPDAAGRDEIEDSAD